MEGASSDARIKLLTSVWKPCVRPTTQARPAPLGTLSLQKICHTTLSGRVISFCWNGLTLRALYLTWYTPVHLVCPEQPWQKRRRAGDWDDWGEDRTQWLVGGHANGKEGQEKIKTSSISSWSNSQCGAVIMVAGSQNLTTGLSNISQDETPTDKNTTFGLLFSWGVFHLVLVYCHRGSHVDSHTEEKPFKEQKVGGTMSLTSNIAERTAEEKLMLSRSRTYHPLLGV